MNIEQLKAEKERDKIILSENVSKQLNNLGITTEMVEGDILDIGAGDAEFAKDFSDKESARIVSIDDTVTDENREKIKKIDARKLPYGDNTYDMVISHAAVPNVFIDMYSSEFPEIAKESIESSISLSMNEIIRVLKPGKTAYLAPILIAEDYESQRTIKEAVFKVIDNLKSKRIDVQLEFLKKEINPQNKEETKIYRLIIKKPIDNTQNSPTKY